MVGFLFCWGLTLALSQVSSSSRSAQLAPNHGIFLMIGIEPRMKVPTEL